MFDALSRFRRYTEVTQEDRCTERFDVTIPARLRAAGEHGFEIIIENISVAGFACSAVTAMPKGAICWVLLPGLAAQQAEVIWNEGGQLGCAFSSLLNPIVLDHLLQRCRPFEQGLPLFR